MNIYKFLATVLIVILFSGNAFSQDWESVKIKTIAINEQVYMLEGRGGNIGLVIGSDELMLIDGQFAELNDKIWTAVRAVSDLPLTYLINTHWHRDHTGGNAGFQARGAEIISQESVKARLVTGGKVEFFGSEVPPQPAEALPVITFGQDYELDLGSETVQVVHVPAAHTDGDAIVFLPQNNVIHAGDIYFAEMYPFIDLGSGGSARGVIDACRQAINMANEKTVVIPGHGPLSDLQGLKDYTAMLYDVTTKVEALREKGVELKELMDRADAITGAYEERFGGGFVSGRDLISFVFNSQ